jgi:tetratricopeptide (TPR) repeat protein
VSFERSDATELAEQALDRKLTPAEVSSYWTTRAFRFIRTHPGQWLRLLVRKFALTWNAVEAMDTEDLYTHARWSWPLWIFGHVWHFGILMPLAGLGLISTWPLRARLTPLYLIVAGYAASLLILYVMGRYRLPMVPILLVFSAAGVTTALDFVRRSSRLMIFGTSITLLLIAVFANWPLLNRAKMGAVTFNELGNTLRRLERFEEAIAQYQQAVRIEPDFVAAYSNCGNALRDAGRPEEAVAHYQAALRIKPDYAEAHYNWGNALQDQARFKEAVTHYEEALRIKPDYAEAHSNLGTALHALGRFDEAVAHFQQALRIKPDYVEAHYNWGVVLQALNLFEEAVTHYQQALRLKPDYAEAYNNCGMALANLGRLQDAVEHLRQALHLKPGNTKIRNNLRRAESLLHAGNRADISR